MDVNPVSFSPAPAAWLALQQFSQQGEARAVERVHSASFAHFSQGKPALRLS